jgi:hypothetical protein
MQRDMYPIGIVPKACLTWEVPCVTHINTDLSYIGRTGTVWCRRKAAILDRPAFKVQSPLQRM